MGATGKLAYVLVRFRHKKHQIMDRSLAKSILVLSPGARLDKLISQKIKKQKYPMVSYLQILKLLQMAAVLSLSYQQ